MLGHGQGQQLLGGVAVIGNQAVYRIFEAEFINGYGFSNLHPAFKRVALQHGFHRKYAIVLQHFTEGLTHRTDQTQAINFIGFIRPGNMQLAASIQVAFKRYIDLVLLFRQTSGRKDQAKRGQKNKQFLLHGSFLQLMLIAVDDVVEYVEIIYRPRYHTVHRTTCRA